MPEWVGARIWHILAALVVVAALNPSPAPGRLRSSLQASALALEGGRPAAALVALEDALVFEPRDPALQWQAASMALAADDMDAVLQYLDAADSLAGPSAKGACLRGDALQAKGDPQGALSVWPSAPSSCPDAAQHLRNLASAYLAIDDARGYEAALSSLVELTPQDATALRALAIAAATQDPETAEAHLRAADQADPEGGVVVRALIRSIDEARAEDSPAYTLAQVGQVLAQNNEWLFASWAFQNALQAEPDYVEARAYLGLALDRTGRDGLPDLEAAAAAAPRAAQPHAFLGMHWQMSGEPSRALTELEMAARLAPDDPAIAAEMAAAYDALGETDSALTAYRRATDLAPRQPGFWLLLAGFSTGHELQVRTIGLPAARNAVALAPQDPAGWDALGDCYLLSGDLAMADRILTRALELAPQRPSTLYHVGLLRLYQGDLAAARAALQSAIQGDPDGPIADLAQRALDRAGP
jgi:tetratricopeptide (TPR) repeat protein